jgi:hypothetical protein
MPDLSVLRAEIERMRYQSAPARRLGPKRSHEVNGRASGADAGDVVELCAERRRCMERLAQYPGTDKPIKRAAERRCR